MGYSTLFKNGNIITMNPEVPEASWMAVEDGKFKKIGAEAECAPSADNVMDLEGKTVLPGLFDAHCHVMQTGFFLSSVDLTKATSISEVKKLIGERAKEAKEGEWIFAGGFMAQKMGENRFPYSAELDEVSEGHPVMVAAQTLHGISLNSKAAEMVNIPNVAGVEKDENGRVKGPILSDDAAFPCMSQIMGLISDDEMMKMIESCSNYAAQKGVTTIIGLMGQFCDGDRDVALALKRRDDLLTNLEIFYQTWDLEKVKKLNLPRIGGCLTLDGAGFEYTMALQDVYPERPERRGFLIHTDEEVYTLISNAHRDGIQCAFHALGDRAIDQLLYCFKQVIGEQGNKDLRHRVEHFSLPWDKHMDMLADMGLIASMQPAFAGYWGDPENGEYIPMLGKERADRMEVFPEIIKRGGMICGGSDSPVTMIDPLFGIASCVNNPDPRRNISVTDAIKIFTINSAYSVNLEESKGTIEEGKDADFSVISGNPYEMATDKRIYDLKALMTVRSGKVVFKES